MKTFYDKDGVVVRTSKIRDAYELANKLRATDVVEVKCSHGYTPRQALEKSIRSSILSLTIVNKGVAVGVFGVYSENILSNKGSIWFLSSQELDDIQVRFLRQGRKFVDLMLSYYPYLENFTDARNRKSLEWLRFLGAKIEDPKPFGVEQFPFHRFYFERN